MLSTLPLSEKILLAIKDMGFTQATPIQDQAIPHILEGKDIIGQAQTGTGKTAAFAIPILQSIDTEDRKTQAIIMCPTRELAMQITEEFKKLSKYLPEIEPLAVYGGQPIDIQLRALRRCPQVVIGTPGRIMDHIRRKTLDLSNIKIVTLDEADEMLDMGFRDDIKTILDSIPEKHQTLLFSATMPRAIMDLSKQYLVEPVLVKTITKNMTVIAIEQIYLEVKERNKLEVISRLIDQFSPKLSLVFCNTKKKVDEVVENLVKLGYKAEGLHGDLRQSQRDAIMNKFRHGNVELLVATDVAARGLDVDDIEIVFNYDIPQDAEYYTHRIGRTGRAGKTGKSFTFVTGREVFKLKDIVRITKSDIKLGTVPSKKEVDSQKAKLYMNNILEEMQKDQDLAAYYEYISTLENDGIDLKDFLATLLKMNLFSQKKTDLFKEIEEGSKTLPTSSYQFRSQEDRRSEFKKEHRFQPSDRFGSSDRNQQSDRFGSSDRNQQSDRNQSSDRYSERDQPRRDFSSSSISPRNNAGQYNNDRPARVEYENKPNNNSIDNAKSSQRPARNPYTESASRDRIPKSGVDSSARDRMSKPSNDSLSRDRMPKAGADSSSSDRMSSESSPRRNRDSSSSFPYRDKSSKPVYNYPKRAKTDAAPVNNPDVPKKPTSRKKTIYQGPDQPRIVITEK